MEIQYIFEKSISLFWRSFRHRLHRELSISVISCIILGVVIVTYSASAFRRSLLVEESHSTPRWVITSRKQVTAVTRLPVPWPTVHNSPISQRFSPSGEQLEHRKLAHELQSTAGCIAIFHKYCCYTKLGGITTNYTLRNHWGYVTDVSKYMYHNVGKWNID